MSVTQDGITFGRLRSLPDHIPIVQSHGIGVDSTAISCKLIEMGVTPRLIQFADTLGEKRETYEYLPILNDFLLKHGCPEVTVVTRQTVHPSLEANCLANDTLPGMAFGVKSCSKAWKIEPMDRALGYANGKVQPVGWGPSLECWDRGDKVIKIIGLDHGEQDSKRFAHVEGRDDPYFTYWYPLRELRMNREACKRVIRNTGLPEPVKSACFFCPASKKEEIRWLQQTHPDLAHRSFLMELNALQGKHGLATTRGLGRSFSWIEFVCSVSPSLAAKYGEWLEVIRDHRGRRYHYDASTRKMLAAVWSGAVRWAVPGFSASPKHKPKGKAA